MSSHAANHKWTTEVLALLGKIPDAAIARRFSMNRVVVMRKRTSMGIPRCGKMVGPKEAKWTEAECQLLRQCDDLQVARMTVKTLREIAAKRKALKQNNSL